MACGLVTGLGSHTSWDNKLDRLIDLPGSTITAWAKSAVEFAVPGGVRTQTGYQPTSYNLTKMPPSVSPARLVSSIKSTIRC